jgi:uncharacterized membrane protein YdbT with pleckstrin-like domain
MVNQIYCTPGTTCSKIPLEKIKILKKSLGAAFGWLIFLVFFAFFFGINVIFNSSYGGVGTAIGVIFLIFILLAVIVFGLSVLWQSLYYKYYFYNLTHDEVIIKKGVISRIEISLPYEKIQNVYVDQDFLDRMFGLYDVHLETAGGASGVVAHIDGVNAQNSKVLRDMLMSSLKKHSKKKYGGL